MSDSITLTGLVATTPRHLVTSEGLAITSFRLASAQRRFDRKEERWIDADTNWYTVTAFRRLAQNLSTSIAKGDRVLVNGRVRIRDWEKAERSGTSVEVEADAVGHDLTWGTAQFTRVISGETSASTGAGAGPVAPSTEASPEDVGWPSASGLAADSVTDPEPLSDTAAEAEESAVAVA